LYVKFIPLQHIDNSLNGIWGNPVGFKLYEIKDKCSRITMDMEEDIQRLLKGNPSIVRNIWFVVHSWGRKVAIRDLDFTHVPLLDINMGSSYPLQVCKYGKSYWWSVRGSA